MSRRTIRLLAAFSLCAALTACGSDDGGSGSDGEDSSSSSGSFEEVPDGIEVTGDFGKPPEVEWTGEVTVDELARTVLIEGDGEEVGEGSNVLAHIWIGNGVSQAQAYSDFDQGANVLNLGDQTLPALAKGLSGQTIGSRVMIASPPADAWGETGNTELGVGNTDTVVFVVDLEGTLPEGPEGTEREPAAWAPAIVLTDDLPSSLDFTDAAKPTGDLEVTTLIEGEGEPVAKGQTVYVNYLGQVPGADKPFDESYSSGQPFSFTVGSGQVIEGWDVGLRGVPVGSRVILQVPPDQGYGKEGQPSVGIEGTDTMYFVVDVLAAS